MTSGNEPDALLSKKVNASESSNEGCSPNASPKSDDQVHIPCEPQVILML